jgi:hypothetical protein
MLYLMVHLHHIRSDFCLFSLEVPLIFYSFSGFVSLGKTVGFAAFIFLGLISPNY